MNLRQAADKAILGLVCPGQVYISPDVYAVMEQNRLVLTVRGQTVLLDVEACGRLEQAAYITRAEADSSSKRDNCCYHLSPAFAPDGHACICECHR